jgi:hypothetical protein
VLRVDVPEVAPIPVATAKATATVSILIILGLAGCIGQDAEPAPDADADVAAPAQFSDETGAVEGLVVDQEQLPIPQAQVAIPELGLQTTSDAGGRFTFSNVKPGTHQLFAQRLGYESVGQAVEIVAGEVTATQLVLTKLAVQEPFNMILTQRGLFGCGASWRPGVIYSGIAICGVFSLFLNDTSYDQFLLDWELEEATEGWDSSVFEMEWESNQAAGRGLTMLWEVCSNDAETRISAEEGESPLREYVTKEQLQSIVTNGTENEDACGDAAELCNVDGCAFISRVFSTPQLLGETSPADVGFTFQQPFTQHASLFMWEPAPEEHTVVMDA